MTAPKAATNTLREDTRVIGLVSVAHYCSHVMQLVLPPLFPILHEEMNVSFIELGLIMTVFYAASGTGQAIAGVLVDRYGPHRLLLGGLAMLSLAVLGYGLAGSYWMFLPLAFVGGLGNSVFHPADLSILSLRVSESRHGRAYGMHGVLGTIGYATSPVVITAVAAYGDWRAALIVCGLIGLAYTAVLFLNRAHLRCHPRRAAAKAGQAQMGTLAILFSPFVLIGFGYFALTSFAGQGVQSFGITALVQGYGLTLALATSAVTAYLLGNTSGMVVGGFLADWTSQHHRVAVTGMLAGAAFMFSVATLLESAPAIIAILFLAGLSYGITQPSRDVLIRRAAAGTGLGSVFGFVYSGFDLGSSTAPLLFGALLDHHMPHAVFVAIATSVALGTPMVLQVRAQIGKHVPAAVAAE